MQSEKKFICLACVVLVSIFLAGCGSSTPADATNPTSSNVRAVYVTLPTGERIICVTYSKSTGAGISCDWNK